MPPPYIDEEGFFLFPTVVRKAHFDHVPSLYRACYEAMSEYPDRYHLTEDGRALKKEMLAKLAELRETHAAAMKKRDDELANLTEESRRHRVHAALSNALEAEGVTSAGLRKGACALLDEQNKLYDEPADDGSGHVVVAETPYGLHSPEFVVRNWLSTDEGRQFLGKQHAPKTGHFGAMLDKMQKER